MSAGHPRKTEFVAVDIGEANCAGAALATLGGTGGSKAKQFGYGRIE